MNGLTFDIKGEKKTEKEMKASDLNPTMIEDLTRAKNEAQGIAQERQEKHLQNMMRMKDRIQECKMALNTLQYKESTPEERAQALELILFHVEDTYVANDFMKIGGISYIMDVLKEHPFESAIPIITTAAHENPTIQNELLKLGAVDFFMALAARKGPTEKMEEKMVDKIQYRAISTLVSLVCTNKDIYRTYMEKHRILELKDMKDLLDIEANIMKKTRNKLFFLLDCLITFPMETNVYENQKTKYQTEYGEPIRETIIPLCVQYREKAIQQKQYQEAAKVASLLKTIAMANQQKPFITKKQAKELLRTSLLLVVKMKKQAVEEAEDFIQETTEMINDYDLAKLSQ